MLDNVHGSDRRYRLSGDLSNEPRVGASVPPLVRALPVVIAVGKRVDGRQDEHFPHGEHAMLHRMPFAVAGDDAAVLGQRIRGTISILPPIACRESGADAHARHAFFVCVLGATFALFDVCSILMMALFANPSLKRAKGSWEHRLAIVAP